MRRKLTLLVPPGVVGLVDDAAKRTMGVGRNAFFVMGALLLVAKLTTIVAGKKRAQILDELDSEWRGIITEARKTL